MIPYLRWGPPILVSTRLLRDAVVAWVAVRAALAAVGLLVPTARVAILIVAVAVALVFLNIRISREPALLGDLGVSRLAILGVILPPITGLELAASIAGRVILGVEFAASL